MVLRLVLEAPVVALDVVPFELQHRLGVGVERGDGRGHAAGEGCPGHATGERRTARAVRSQAR